MEYTIEFGAVLVLIVIVALAIWSTYWKNEIKITVDQRNRLKCCGQLLPTRFQFSKTSKTDVIHIESLKSPAPRVTTAARQRKTIARQQ